MATLPRTQLYVQASGSAVQHHTIAVISPNGTTFNQNGDIVAFDLERGYLVPTLYLRYRARWPWVRRLLCSELLIRPFWSHGSYIGNNTVETIQDFNKVCNFITTCKLPKKARLSTTILEAYQNRWKNWSPLQQLLATWSSQLHFIELRKFVPRSPLRVRIQHSRHSTDVRFNATASKPSSWSCGTLLRFRKFGPDRSGRPLDGWRQRPNH
jgi:hypothetical protein